MSTKLLQPFSKFGGFLIFLFLEALCFYLVVNFNKKHNQIYLSTANAVAGTAYDRYDAISDYFSLKKQIQALREENAKLRDRLDIAQYENIATLDTLTSSDSTIQKFSTIPAKVISNFYANTNNVLTIDRGRRHGVGPDMGVIDANGIVGITRQVSRNYATVMSLYHKQSRISAAIKKTNAFGALEWDGQNSELLDLKAIPKHETVEIGDTVITSGYGHHFPKGIVIGQIADIKLESGSNYYALKVALVNDLRRLRHVYVINNLMREEIDHLEASSE